MRCQCKRTLRLIIQQFGAAGQHGSRLTLRHASGRCLALSTDVAKLSCDDFRFREVKLHFGEREHIFVCEAGRGLQTSTSEAVSCGGVAIRPKMFLHSCPQTQLIHGGSGTRLCFGARPSCGEQISTLCSGLSTERQACTEC